MIYLGKDPVGITNSTRLTATKHEIYLEFTDSTDITIPVHYDDPLIGTMITAYTPKTYSDKTVSVAELDGVAWYEYSPIPIGTELIDYTLITNNMAINSQGEVIPTEWYYTSDYTEVDPEMTFSYVASLWHYIAIFDENKNILRTIYVYTDGTVDPSDSNIGHGTLSGSKLTGARYVRICSTYNSLPGMSLVRTA